MPPVACPWVQAIANSVTRNPRALVNLARLKTADDYSYLHSVAVCARMPSEVLNQPSACTTTNVSTAAAARTASHLGIYPNGSLLRLVSGKLAVVVEQNPEALTLPTVKVFFSTKANLPVPPQLIALANSSERIAGREPREAWKFPQLERLWAGDVLGA